MVVTLIVIIAIVPISVEICCRMSDGHIFNAQFLKASNGDGDHCICYHCHCCIYLGFRDLI